MIDAVSAIEKQSADRFAKRFDRRKLRKWYLSRTRDPSWKHILPLLTGRTILDLGCGLGFDSVIFTKRGYHVVGVDISPLSIEKAEEFAKDMKVSRNIKFNVANINSDEFSEKFDVVFGRSILHHLTAKPLEHSVKTIKSLLNEHGRAIFVEPLDKNPFVNINRRFLDPYDRTPTEKPLSLKETNRAFTTSFRCVEHKELYLLSPISYIFRKIIRSPSAFEATQRLFEKLDQPLLENIRTLQQYAWITIISASDDNVSFDD